MTGPTPQAPLQPAPCTGGWQQLPALDPRTLANWRNALPAPKLREIYGMFQQQTSQRLLALQGSAAPDRIAFASAVHAIAGSAGMVGAARLEGVCRSARQQVGSGPSSAQSIASLRDDIQHAFDELSAILREEGLAA